MSLWTLPWLEMAVALSLLGAVVVNRFRDPLRAFLAGLGCTGAALACAVLAWLGVALGAAPAAGAGWSAQPYLFGRPLFAVDQLTAPLVALVALLHFLTALATGRTKM